MVRKCTEIAEKMKIIFATHGVPKELVADMPLVHINLNSLLKNGIFLLEIFTGNKYYYYKFE